MKIVINKYTVKIQLYTYHLFSNSCFEIPTTHFVLQNTYFRPWGQALGGTM